MKITSAGLEHYQSLAKTAKRNGNAADKAKAAAAPDVKADKVTISDSAVARAEAARISPALAAEVEETASPQRLEELRAAVETGTYHVSAEDIADAILNVTA